MDEQVPPCDIPGTTLGERSLAGSFGFDRRRRRSSARVLQIDLEATRISRGSRSVPNSGAKGRAFETAAREALELGAKRGASVEVAGLGKSIPDFVGNGLIERRAAESSSSIPRQECSAFGGVLSDRCSAGADGGVACQP